MGVDESGDDDLAADVDLAGAAIVGERACDAVGANRHVTDKKLARYEVEDVPALENEVGLVDPLPLRDGAGQKGGGVAHPDSFETDGIVSGWGGRLKAEQKPRFALALDALGTAHSFTAPVRLDT